MLILLTYYSDGSEIPMLYFIESGQHQMGTLVESLIESLQKGQRVAIYQIDDLSKQPTLLYEQQEIPF